MKKRGEAKRIPCFRMWISKRRMQKLIAEAAADGVKSALLAAAAAREHVLPHREAEAIAEGKKNARRLK